jgi:hypothetical protein
MLQDFANEIVLTASLFGLVVLGSTATYQLLLVIAFAFLTGVIIREWFKARWRERDISDESRYSYSLVDAITKYDLDIQYMGWLECKKFFCRSHVNAYGVDSSDPYTVLGQNYEGGDSGVEGERSSEELAAVVDEMYFLIHNLTHSLARTLFTHLLAHLLTHLLTTHYLAHWLFKFYAHVTH